MAPRPPESFESFEARLRAALARGVGVVRFGRHHHDRAVCAEDGRLWLRRLEVSDADAAEHLRVHGHFMPEDAEQIARPGALVFEAEDVEALLDHLRAAWDA
jgi:hypothetical protein